MWCVRPAQAGISVLIPLLLLSAAPAVLAGGASAQANDCQANSDFKCCGDILLDFLNPGLKARGDGKVHAHGQLFAQFQAIGDGADQIATFGFSFSPVGQELDETAVCGQEPWVPSGPYIINYRADTDPSDGFFINLQTTLVPDGDYMAAVHAYDASDNEIARAWTLAFVDNCNGDAGARCDSEQYPTQEHQAQDLTEPWPIMLPGDGELDPAKNGAPADATLTLEFAEPLSQLRVTINGELIHEKDGAVQGMVPFDGRIWDDDLLPGYGPYGSGGTIAPECSQTPPQSCGTLGESWVLTGRDITGEDVVRVEATDLAGNLAKKEIHIGSVGGGAITLDVPRLQITVDEPSKTVAAGESAVFGFVLRNQGGATGHPFTSYDDPVVRDTLAPAPGVWEVSWRPHEAINPGEERNQELTVRPGVDVPPGIYQVNGTISWNEGNEQKDRTWELQVNVGGVSENSTVGNEIDEQKDAGKDSPGPAFVGLLAALGVAATVVRRRRQ